MSRRWTAADLASLSLAAQARRSGVGTDPASSPGVIVARGAYGAVRRKYRNVPVTVDGWRFDSRLESRCWQWLRLRLMAGELKLVLRQVPFHLPGSPRPVVYRADFLAHRADGDIEVIDAKGRDTRDSINKRKQVRALYGVEVQLWKG